jgi:lipopolysaccharide transport system ATP-binding protein
MKAYEEDLVSGPREDDPPTGGAARLVLPEGRSQSGAEIVALTFAGAAEEGDRAPNVPPRSGHPARLILRCSARIAVSNVSFGLLIREMNAESDCVLNLFSERDDRVFEVPAGRSEIEVAFPQLSLKPGAYTAKVYLTRPGLEMLDAVESFRFRVDAGENMTQCQFYQARSWRSRPVGEDTADVPQFEPPTGMLPR